MFQRGQSSYQSLSSATSLSSFTGRRDSARSGHAAQRSATNGSMDGPHDGLRTWLPGQGHWRNYFFGGRNGSEGPIAEDEVMPSFQRASITSDAVLPSESTIMMNSVASHMHAPPQIPYSHCLVCGREYRMPDPLALGGRCCGQPVKEGRRQVQSEFQAMRNQQDEEDDRRNWMPDEKSKMCYNCNTSFTAFRRRHHCRLCGQIFCHYCSSNFVAGKTINRPKEEKSRVCGKCLKHVQGPVEAANAGFEADELPPVRRPNTSRHPPEVSLNDNSEDSSSITPSGMGGGSSTRLPMARDASHALVDQDEEDSDDASDSLSGTNVGEEEDSEDDDDLRFDVTGTIDATMTMPGGWSSRAMSVWAESDVDSVDDNTPRPREPQESFPINQPPRGQRELGLPAAALQHLSSVQEELDSRLESHVAAKKHEEAWRKISDEAFRHFARSVRACCKRKGHGLEDQSVIVSICELARQVTDHIAPLNGDLMDILSYVKIKRIPGGDITDSQWVDGVVFSRDVAHRKMSTCLTPCQIVLLGDSVRFDNNDRHTVLDELFKQEDRSLGNKALKIAELHPKPQLLLCQGGVSQMARAKLRDKNISLILGVPPHILKAVERCTGANVLQAVESIEIRENAVAAVGLSRYFAVQHTGDVGSKALAVIESSPAHRNRCCTICLRGGGSMLEKDAKEFLTHAKTVLQWSVRLARHLQLESKLLFEIWCEPRQAESPDMRWQKICSQLEEYQSCRICEKCHSEYKSPEPASGMCCGVPVKNGRRPNAPVPRTIDEVLRGESLDLLCYSVSKADLTCSRPISFSLPAYVSPDCEPEPPQTNFPNENGLGWAGGLDVRPLRGIRDCTLQEWLKSCFEDNSPFGSAAATPQQSGSCFPAPGLHTAIGHGANRANASQTSDGGSAVSFGHGGAHARGGGLDLSGSGGFYKSHAHLHNSRLSLGEPPVPTKGTVLCFQHLRSRIVVELRDHDEPVRGRTQSDAQRGASTRWSLLQSKSQDDPPSFNMSSDNLDCSLGSDVANNMSHLSSKVQSSASSDRFEVWRWCRCCKNHHITPRHALSTSAGWLSFAKFLEMLLHNSTSKCCPLSCSEGEPCPHSAFRDHVLFFSCPHKPMVVGFKWERIDAWRLHPPNLPLWDPKTFALEEDSTIELDNYTPHFKHDNCEMLLTLYQGLVQLIDAFLDCALTALSLIKDDSIDRSGVDTMGALLSRATANAIGSRSSANLAAHAEFELDLPMSATCLVKSKESSLGKHLPPWLHGWIWENKGDWHSAISMLNALQTYLKKHLEIAKSRLESSRSDNDMDPIVVGFVQRDLLEGLGDNPPSLPGLKSFSSVRAACAELSRLKKLSNTPQFEESPVELEQSGMSLSKLWEGPRRHVAAWFSNFSNFTSPLPMDHAESQLEAYTSELGSRSRAKSQTRSSPRNRLLRSNSFSGEKVDAERRSSSRCFSNDTKITSLQEELPRILKELSQKLEQASKDEIKLREASLPRGVMNLSLPVHAEDVGSVISYALLSCETEANMKLQFERILGKTTCCPCCGLHGSPASCCFFSLPASLRSDARARSSTLSSFQSEYCSQISDISLAQSMPLPADLPFSNRLPTNHWKSLPELFGDDVPLACQNHSWEREWEQLGVRNVLTTDMSKLPATPIKLENINVDNASYQVTIHHAPQYHILRHWLCGDDLNFVRSLHRCTSIRPSGGKSGASFFISDDKRFLVKAVNRHEFKLLKEKGEALFRYADKVLFDKLPSVLAQVLGVFTVARRGKTKQDTWTKNYIVQRNLRYKLWSRPHSCFDLKGVGKNRRVAGTELPVPEERQLEDDDDVAGNLGSSRRHVTFNEDVSTVDLNRSATEVAPIPPANKSVLWDQNFREWRDGKPLCLPEWDLKYLEAAIWNDTCLLAGQSLVDYSMLLAAAPPEGPDSMKAYGTVAIGIIDYLRPYTLDKQAETVIKTLVSGQPTVIEPSDYSRRFRQAMGTFFVAETPSPTCE